MLIDDAAASLNDIAGLDLTVELITHRFNTESRAELDSWQPGSALDMTDTSRVTKRTRFGAEKQVQDAATMRTLRSILERRIAEALPMARVLYWTQVGAVLGSCDWDWR